MAKRMQTHATPPKQLAYPADFNALGAAGGMLKQKRAEAHHARMSKADNAAAERAAVKSSLRRKGKKGKR